MQNVCHSKENIFSAKLKNVCVDLAFGKDELQRLQRSHFEQKCKTNLRRFTKNVTFWERSAVLTKK